MSLTSGADKQRYGDKLQENVRKFANRILEILTENKVKVGPSGSFKIKPRGTKETTLELSPGMSINLWKSTKSVSDCCVCLGTTIKWELVLEKKDVGLSAFFMRQLREDEPAMKIDVLPYEKIFAEGGPVIGSFTADGPFCKGQITFLWDVRVYVFLLLLLDTFSLRSAAARRIRIPNSLRKQSASSSVLNDDG
eukprot:SAG31_NODE_3949_length_3725_cov_1.821566_4_plen_194_part_00